MEGFALCLGIVSLVSQYIMFQHLRARVRAHNEMEALKSQMERMVAAHTQATTKSAEALNNIIKKIEFLNQDIANIKNENSMFKKSKFPGVP